MFDFIGVSNQVWLQWDLVSIESSYGLSLIDSMHLWKNSIGQENFKSDWYATGFVEIKLPYFWIEGGIIGYQSNCQV